MVKFKSIVTDPSEHRDESFVYLVSGIVQVYPETNTEEAEEYMQWRIDRILTPGQFYSGSLVGHLDEADAKQVLRYHGGNVHQTSTFGKYGFIINPSEEAIRIAWNHDLGRPFPDELPDYMKRNDGKIKSPIRLLTQVPKDSYSEIVLEGNKNSKIQGVFYKVTDLDNKDIVFSKRWRAKALQLADLVSRQLSEKITVVDIPSDRVTPITDTYLRKVPLINRLFPSIQIPQTDDWTQKFKYFDRSLMGVVKRSFNDFMYRCNLLYTR